MMKRNLLTGFAIAAVAFSACNDEIIDIGNSLTSTADKFSVSTADFKVSTRTVIADSILIRSSYCYLGKVKDPETRSYVTSEFMTQFNILETFSLPKAETIASTYDGMVAADSCHLELYMLSPNSVTDTLAAMKIRASELGIPMEEGRKYYSNYDPVAEGLIRKDGLYKDKMFTYNDLTVSEDTRNETDYYNVIKIKLDQPYTDKNGKTYKNYGTYLMHQYFQHPEYFKNSYAFIHNVCPGFFISVTDGEGVYTEIGDMSLRFYYQIKTEKADSTSLYATAIAGTEEVLQTTKITNSREKLEQLVADNTCTYIKAPAGLYTEVTLPVDDIRKGHENDTVMTASISFQRVNNLEAEETFKVPNYMMMVPKDSLNHFFENQKLPDNKLTFSTTYQKKTNDYSFSNISSLINRLADIKREGLNNDKNWEANHPNWNKVLLVPVQAITNSASGSTTVSGYEHCVDIVSTKLMGGSENAYSPIMLNVIYGNFNQ